MENDLTKEAKEIAKSELKKAFDVVPLTEKQRELFICVAAQIYNRGHIDAIKAGLAKTG
jgi:hypothetical protein